MPAHLVPVSQDNDFANRIRHPLPPVNPTIHFLCTRDYHFVHSNTLPAFSIRGSIPDLAIVCRQGIFRQIKWLRLSLFFTRA
jgi:hypothetical protein